MSISLATNNGTIVQISTCGTSLLAGSSCTVTLTWTPSIAGTMTGNLTFVDNASNNAQIVTLTGVGVSAAVTLSPTSLTLPNQVVFTKSAAKKVTLTNTGTGTLTITALP